MIRVYVGMAFHARSTDSIHVCPFCVVWIPARFAESRGVLSADAVGSKQALNSSGHI